MSERVPDTHVDQSENHEPNMVDARVLLGHISAWLSAAKEYRKAASRELASDFNAISLLNPNETRLSSILADILNPNGSHGQGSIFIERFLLLLGIEYARKTASANIELEKQVCGQRRIDIFIELEDLIIGIENKPWAHDPPNQLSDYIEYTRSRASQGKKWVFVYLCNREPSEGSIGRDHRETLLKEKRLVELNFNSIASWIDNCAKESSASQVRFFLQDFSGFIKRNICGELPMTESHKITNIILESKSHLTSALAINRSFNDLAVSLFSLLYSQLMEKLNSDRFVIECNELLDKGRMARAFAGLNVRASRSQDILLRFHFEKSNMDIFFWGLSSRFWDSNTSNGQSTKDRELWKKIKNEMDTIFWEGKSSTVWPWYTESPNTYFGNEYRNWRENDQPWLEIYSGSLADKIIRIANEVYSRDGLLSLLEKHLT